MRGETRQETHVEHEKVLKALNRLKKFLWANALHVALIIAIIALGVTGARYYIARRETTDIQAWQTLALLPDASLMMMQQEEKAAAIRGEAISACRDILDNASGTTATPWVLLRLGGLLAEEGKWESALTTYRRLLRNYRGTSAAKTAMPAYAAALEETGSYAEAASIYADLAADGQEVFLLDAGRCRELSGEPELAAAEYRRLTDTSAPERLRDMARTRLAALEDGRILSLPPEPKEPKESGIEDAPETPGPPAEAEAPGPARVPSGE